jgi:hypothetical protein
MLFFNPMGIQINTPLFKNQDSAQIRQLKRKKFFLSTIYLTFTTNFYIIIWFGIAILFYRQ